MIHLRRNIWIQYRKWWLIGAGAGLGLLVVGGIIIWNVFAWQDYERRYMALATTVRAETDKVLVLPMDTASDRENKRRSLTSLHYMIAENRDVCMSYQILHWQKGIPSVKERIDRCTDVAEKLGQFGSKIDSVTDYLDAEQAMTKILEKGISGKLDEAAWKQQPQVWQDIEKELAELSTPDSFREVGQLAKATSKHTQEAWQVLVQASEAKDRAKYEDATNKLSAMYDTLGELIQQSEKTFLSLVMSLEASYQDVFR